MKDSQQNELKIGDSVNVSIDGHVTYLEDGRIAVDLFGYILWLTPQQVTRIPDDPKPYTPDPSLFAAPVQGSKPEEK